MELPDIVATVQEAVPTQWPPQAPQVRMVAAPRPFLPTARQVARMEAEVRTKRLHWFVSGMVLILAVVVMSGTLDPAEATSLATRKMQVAAFFSATYLVCGATVGHTVAAWRLPEGQHFPLSTLTFAEGVVAGICCPSSTTPTTPCGM